MKTLEIGIKIKNFTAKSTNKDDFILKNYLGSYLVIFFYPKDNTSGCTQEGIDFSENYNKFKKLNTEIFGISRDSLKSHNNFKEKYGFKFDLISDTDESICNSFGVIKEKSMYGKKYMGVERSTFIIDADGLLIKEWRKVKVKGHVAEVLKYLKELN
jgi:peroxiredoxin Q/BCP